MNKKESYINKYIKSVSGVQYLICSITSIAAAMIYINYMNYALSEKEVFHQGKWNSLTIYIVGLIIFLAVYFSLFFIFLSIRVLKHQRTNKNSENGGVKLPFVMRVIVILSVYLVGISLMIQYLFFTQKRELGFNEGNFLSIPNVVWIVFGFTLLTYVFSLLIKRRDIGLYGKYFAYAVSIAVSFFPVFILNPFVEGSSSQGYYTCGFVNFNIVWESIYNVLDSVPYTLDTTPLYGHYALFFLFPLKMADKENYILVISLVFGLLACVQQIATIYIINTFSPKNWIAALLSIASVVRLTYYAVHLSPIRTLAPMIWFAFFAYLYKNKKRIMSKYSIITSIALLSFSILFNVEIGAACTIGLCAYIIFELICEKASLYEWISRVVKLVLMCVFSVIIAISVVDVYNILCGGPVIARAFFFPLIGGDTQIVNYIHEHFDWPVPLGNNIWEYILVFFLGMICIVWYFAWRNNTFEEKAALMEMDGNIVPLTGGIVSTGIVAFAYYMNEPLWTDLVVYKQIIYGIFAIILGRTFVLFEKRECPYVWQQFVKGVSLLLITATTFGAVQLINDPVRIAARKWAGAYDPTTFKAQLAQLDIPEDTYGLGQGINILYHELGLENHTRYRDTSEMDMPYSYTFEKVIQEIEQNDKFLLTNNPYDEELYAKLQSRGYSFTQIKTYQIGSWEYSYCNVIHNEAY